MIAIKVSSIVLALGLSITGCTRIKLTEKEAFDIKRTISPDYFENYSSEIEVVKFQSGDTLWLNGWFIRNSDSDRTVLYFGGNGFVMVTSFHIIKSIIDQNVNLMVFDYRGYGENPGVPTAAGLKEDGLSAYDYLTGEKGIDPGSLIVHGHSMGSFVAAYVAGEREAAGLVLECPVTNAKDWTGRLVPLLLKPLVRFDVDPSLLENDNLQRLSALDIPLLIIAGEDDQVTPPGMAEDLHQTAKTSDKKLVIIEDGGHNDLPQKKEYRDLLGDFYRTVFDSAHDAYK